MELISIFWKSRRTKKDRIHSNLGLKYWESQTPSELLFSSSLCDLQLDVQSLILVAASWRQPILQPVRCDVTSGNSPWCAARLNQVDPVQSTSLAHCDNTVITLCVCLHCLSHPFFLFSLSPFLHHLLLLSVLPFFFPHELWSLDQY